MKPILRAFTDFLGTAIGNAIGTVALGLFFALAKSYKDGIEFLSIFADWRLLVSPFLVAALTVVVVLLAVKAVRLQRGRKADRDTLSQLGVRLFSKHETPEEKQADWSQMASDLKEDINSSIWILGSTGKETFGGPNSPLGAVLRGHKNALRVILLRPFSKGFERRYKEVQQDEGSFLEETLDAIDFCSELKRKYKVDIELKVCSEVAIWKMVVTSRQLWLQYYAPGVHVEDTPLYCFESLQGDKGLYAALKSVFHKRWTLDNNPKIDLDRWRRSDAVREWWDRLKE